MSERALDALGYMPGPYARRVEGSGPVDVHRAIDPVSGEPISVGASGVFSQIRVLWVIDASDVLRRFARACALDVVYTWQPPPIMLQYLVTGAERVRPAAWYAAGGAKGGHHPWQDPAELAEPWRQHEEAIRVFREAAEGGRGAVEDAVRRSLEETSGDAGRQAALAAAAWDTPVHVARGAAGRTLGVAKVRQSARLEAWLEAAHAGTFDAAEPIRAADVAEASHAVLAAMEADLWR